MSPTATTSGAHRAASSRPRSTGRRGRSTVIRNPMLTALFWAITRVSLLIVLAIVLLRKHDRTLASTLANWDVQHYITIAQHGYADKNDMAFFPGLPILLRALHTVGISYPLAGVILGLAGSALATWALYRIGGTMPAALWLIAPTTVFTLVGYTEAPFCAAAFWAWERARAGKWWQASLLAGLACTFRVSGVFLVIALVVLALVGNGEGKSQDLPRSWPQRIHNAFWMIVPTAVVAAYIAYLYYLTGSWTAWLQAQQTGWARGFKSPIEAFKTTWNATDPAAWQGRPLVARVFVFEIVSMAVGVALTVVCLVRRRWAEATWVGLQLIAFGTSTWFMSVNRAVLLWFPLFLVLGQIFFWRPRSAAGRQIWSGVTMLGVAASLGLSWWWAWLLFTGQWAS